jgi:hypothetical protein
MKAPKAICAAIVLALTLSIPTYAGDVLIPGYTAPPPPPPPAINTEPTSTSPDPGNLNIPSASTLGDITSEYADMLWIFSSIF